MRKTKLEQKIDQLIEEKSLCVDLDNREWRKQCMKMGIPFFQAAHNVFIGPAEAVVCFRSESEIEKGRSEVSDLHVPDGETLSDQFEWIFTRVNAAINDREQEFADRDRSYSRSIVVPLFKYGNHTSRLVVKKLCLNTIKLLVQITYLNKPDSCTKLYVNVPFLEINHAEKIKESIWRELEAEVGSEKSFSDMDDKIDIDADIVGFTLDAAALKKDQLLRLAYTQEDIGWHRSYRTDKEVISSEKLWCKEEIRSDAATQLARYLAVYCLCDDMASINKLLAAYEAEDMTEGFEYNVYEKWAFRQIHAYLLKEPDNVRKDWMKLFGKKDGTYKDYFVAGGSSTKIDRQTAMELMERLRKNGQLLSDDRLYHRVMEITKSM